jgi:multiple sugar transport system permease protein
MPYEYSVLFNIIKILNNVFSRRETILLSRKAKENITGFIFILPSMIGFIIFTLIALIFTIIVSMTKWDMMTFDLKQFGFVGFGNYINMFTDNTFLVSLANNFYFVLFIPLYIFISLTIAVLVNNGVYAKGAIRGLLYLPNITSFVAVAMMWSMLLNPNAGIVNNTLYAIGIENPPGWLSSIFWVKPSIVIMTLWSSIGYNALIYAGGLQSIPSQLYEAAEVDGANKIQQFFKITFPMIAPINFFMVVMYIINIFKMWSNVQILTNGGPGISSTVVGFYIYKTIFKFFDAGYASAMSCFVFVIVLLFTIIQWRFRKSWVNE